MEKKLKGKRVAILATHGFEQSELFSPKEALEEAGAHVQVIAPNGGSIKSWKDSNWGREIAVDATIAESDPADFDALMLPGGTLNADHLRLDGEAVKFVKAFAAGGKPIAAICHAPWLLIETGKVMNHTVTSWPSLRNDLQNAGARWVDEEVVVDHGWVTSRKPADLPAFNKKMIEEFAKEGRSARSDMRATG